MKILVLSDQESQSLYQHYSPEKLANIDLVISCGDLKPAYLEFFSTMTNTTVIYVLGNHDKWYPKQKAGGCICIEDDIFVYNGIRILGLGGSMRYHPEASCQYTEQKCNAALKSFSGSFVVQRDSIFS